MEIDNNTKEFNGSCHCGSVRYHCKLESELLTHETLKCNCSYCLKTRFWEIRVKVENFKLLKGEDSLSNYLYNEKVNDNFFCKSCGVNTHSLVKGEEVPDAPYYVVAVTTIEGLTHEQLSKLKVTCLDGHNDAWWNEPQFKTHL